MLRKLGLVDLIQAVQNKVEQNTEGVRCYDSVPKNAPSPFYFVEVVGKRPADTKTMFCEIFTVWIHAIAAPDNGSSIGIYSMIESLEESMTEDIELPECFNLILQSSTGVQTIKTDETKEKHAVLAYEFKVSYGFKVKV